MIRAAIFDKDGTLFDFRASWGAWTRSVIAQLCLDPAQASGLAETLGFDLQTGDFDPASIVIAHTTHEIAEVIALRLNRNVAALKTDLADLAASAAMVPAVDLPAVFGGLRAMGLKIGLATNDTEIPARRHLSDAGLLETFDFIAGCDSGWGGKPGPGQLLAFAEQCGLDPSQVAMVGDSAHDMLAASRAGMARVGVLTGIATAAELQPHCDVVLPDISFLAAWINQRNHV